MQWNETKPPLKKKTQVELQTEYKAICEAAGDKQFQISTLQAQLYLLNEQLFKISEQFEKANAPKEPTPTHTKETLRAP